MQHHSDAFERSDLQHQGGLLASNGSVKVSGNRIVYVSRAGFVGEDHLSYAREGQDMLNHPITRTVDLTVRVSEHL